MNTTDIERSKLELLIRVDTKTVATAVEEFVRAFAARSLIINKAKLAALAA